MQISLYDKNIGFCKACYACFRTGKCILNADTAAMDEAFRAGKFL